MTFIKPCPIIILAFQDAKGLPRPRRISLTTEVFEGKGRGGGPPPVFYLLSTIRHLLAHLDHKLVPDLYTIDIA